MIQRTLPSGGGDVTTPSSTDGHAVRHTYRLEEVPRAIADFAGGSLGKLGVTIDG